MKTATVSLILISFCSLTHGQSFYMKFGGGYSFPLASYPIDSKTTGIYLRETDPETGFYVPAIINTDREVTGSYNSGLTSAVTFGYLFPSNMGLEINMGYVYGKKYKGTSEIKDVLDDEVLNSSESSTVSYSKNAYLVPSFVLTTDERTLRPYVSAGVVLAFATVNGRYDHRSDYEFDSGTLSRAEKYSGGLSIGLRGAAGVDLKLKQKLSLFSEVALTGMSYYPQERETTQYEVNGEDMLNTLKENARRTKFVKSLNYDSRSNEDSVDQPSKALRSYFGMSSITALAGLKVHL